jgi:hypothetical protein
MTKKKAAPDLGPHAAGYLNIYWNAEERSLFADGGIPRSDQALAFDVLCHERWSPPSLLDPNQHRMVKEPSFDNEMEERGYDMTTFRMFIVRRQHPWIHPCEVIVNKSTGQHRRIHHVKWRGKAQPIVVFCVGDDMDKPSSEQFSLEQIEREFMKTTPETEQSFIGAGI